MQNIKLTIAYDGTEYAGWQIQKNARTVQLELERALKKVTRQRIRLIGAGRTDAGVHAEAQVANFVLKKEYPVAKLMDALNANMPGDISVIKAERAPEGFHAQFSAKSKIYRYTIMNAGFEDPTRRRFYYRVPYKLDFEAMKREAGVLAGRHDFRAFQAKSATSPVRNTVRKIKRITVTKKKTMVHITLESDGFLHNMARNIVGTLIEIGRGYFAEGQMRRILNSKDRRTAGPTAPARGLTLVKVKY